MKKTITVIAILAIALIAMGQTRFWAARRYRFLRSVTSTEDTQLTVSTQQTAPDASNDGTVVLTDSGGEIGLATVRFIGTDAADETLAWTLWAWKSELDPARYVAHGTATLGLTQTGNTNEFYADTIDITAQEWFSTISVSDGAPSAIIANAGIAELVFDTAEYVYWKVVIRDIAGGGVEASTAGSEITTHVARGSSGGGDSTASGALLSSQIAWTVVDTTTAADTEPDDLGVTERTYATVLAAIAAASAGAGDEEISYTSIPSTWNALRFRCIGATDGGVVTYQIYLGTLGGDADCELAKAGQLAFVIGTQVSITSGYEMADAVTVTAADWAKSWGSASPSSNQCAEAAIDIMGADFLVVVPSATDTDCKLLVKGY